MRIVSLIVVASVLYAPVANSIQQGQNVNSEEKLVFDKMDEFDDLMDERETGELMSDSAALDIASNSALSDQYQQAQIRIPGTRLHTIETDDMDTMLLNETAEGTSLLLGKGKTHAHEHAGKKHDINRSIHDIKPLNKKTKGNQGGWGGSVWAQTSSKGHGHKIRMKRTCSKKCEMGTSGDCQHESSAVAQCFEKVNGLCPAGTLHCPTGTDDSLLQKKKVGRCDQECTQPSMGPCKATNGVCYNRANGACPGATTDCGGMNSSYLTKGLTSKLDNAKDPEEFFRIIASLDDPDSPL